MASVKNAAAMNVEPSVLSSTTEMSRGYSAVFYNKSIIDCKTKVFASRFEVYLLKNTRCDVRIIENKKEKKKKRKMINTQDSNPGPIYIY